MNTDQELNETRADSDALYNHKSVSEAESQFAARAAYSLQKISMRLSFLSLFIYLSTISTVGLIAYSAYAKYVMGGNKYAIAILFYSGFTTGTTLMCAIVFDIIRKNGASITDGLVDILHRARETGAEEKSQQNFYDTYQPVRLAIRRFTYQSNLPLIPGQYGAAILVLINAALVMFGAINIF